VKCGEISPQKHFLQNQRQIEAQVLLCKYYSVQKLVT
jgi:hypothetical protein